MSTHPTGTRCPVDDVGPGLESWLADHGEPGATVVVGGRATGGLSQETWFARVRTAAGEEAVVVRLPTTASGGRSITTQVEALQTLASTDVPVPALRWWDLGDGFDGRPFLVMTRAVGDVPTGWHRLEPTRRAALAIRAVDVLADLHATSLDGTPLGGRDPHPLMTMDGLARALDRFPTVPLPVARAIAWLGARSPDRHDPAVIVHGDYRMGNLAVTDDDITAVLDWELAAPGPREVDLVWCFLAIFEPAGVEEVDLVRRYAERAGWEPDPDVLRWHLVHAHARLAYYSLSASHAFDRGRSQDLRLAALRLRLPATLGRLAAAMEAVGAPGRS